MNKLRKILITLSLLLPLSMQAQIVTEDEWDEVIDSVLTDTIMVDSVLIEGERILPWPLYMTSRIDTMIVKRDVMKTNTLGLMIYDATADSVLYRYNDTKLMTPASNEKLITGITAIKRLGKDYRFNTRLLYTGEIRVDTVAVLSELVVDSLTQDSVLIPFDYVTKRVLHGDVYGVGAFDPMFSGTELKVFADKVAALQIDSIAGNFYEDLSLKDTIKWGKGWCWDDSDNPTLTPLLVDKAKGFMGKLRDALRLRNVYLGGFVGTRVCPPEAILLDEKTRTLNQILPRMMKRSDNLYAEAVFYQLGALSGRRNVTAGDSENVINELIREIGLNPDTYRIVDGSGLSHYNRLSPELIVEYLKYARNNKDVFDVLYPTLPIAGVDGTLTNRIKDAPAYRNVRAKTGTLTGVVTLSGYVTAANGHELVFSIMLNGVKSGAVSRAFADDLCLVMAHDETKMIERKPVVVKKKQQVRRRKGKAPAKKTNASNKKKKSGNKKSTPAKKGGKKKRK